MSTTCYTTTRPRASISETTSWNCTVWSSTSFNTMPSNQHSSMDGEKQTFTKCQKFLSKAYVNFYLICAMTLVSLALGIHSSDAFIVIMFTVSSVFLWTTIFVTNCKHLIVINLKSSNWLIFSILSRSPRTLHWEAKTLKTKIFLFILFYSDYLLLT